jgi:hypothetical protein
MAAEVVHDEDVTRLLAWVGLNFCNAEIGHCSPLQSHVAVTSRYLWALRADLIFPFKPGLV